MPVPRGLARRHRGGLRAIALGMACALAHAATSGAASGTATAPAPPVVAKALGHLGDPQVRPGPWNASKVPDGWILTESDHYQVQSQVGPDKAARLADHLEGMLALYGELLPTRRKMPVFVLKIFRNREAYRAYGGDGIAHYDRVHKELVCYDTGLLLGVSDFPVELRMARGAPLDLDEGERARIQELFGEISVAYTTDVAAVLSHEGWHQYFHEYTVSWVAMPSWIDEGVGDWFATAQRDPETGAYRLGGLNHRRLRDIRSAMVAGEAVAFDELLGFEQADYYEKPDVYYAQGWSMVAFLMQSAQPRYRTVVPDLIQHFKRSKDFRRSTQRAFDKLAVSMSELDAQWAAWVVATEPHDPLRELAREFGDRLDANQLVGPAEWKDAYRVLVAEEAAARPAGRPESPPLHGSEPEAPGDAPEGGP